MGPLEEFGRHVQGYIRELDDRHGPGIPGAGRLGIAKQVFVAGATQGAHILQVGSGLGFGLGLGLGLGLGPLRGLTTSSTPSVKPSLGL